MKACSGRLLDKSDPATGNWLVRYVRLRTCRTWKRSTPCSDDQDSVFCRACGALVCHERRSIDEPPEAEYDGVTGAYCPACWDYVAERPRRKDSGQMTSKGQAS
jgi:hypothetical protein